jgi:hypothetical protein
LPPASSGSKALRLPGSPNSPYSLEYFVLKRLHLKLIASAATLTALVAILEAGGKWH